MLIEEIQLDLEKWLNTVVVGAYIIDNGIVNVKGSVYITKTPITRLPCQFGTVTEDFVIRAPGLKTLVGSPKIVGHFSCGECSSLTSLLNGPRQVTDGDYICSECNLITLQGAPTEVPESFYCYNNTLKTLQGAPRTVGGDFKSYACGLVSLVGSPDFVGGEFDVSYNKLRSLKGAPNVIKGDLDCRQNEFNGTPDTSAIDIHGRLKWD